MLGMELAVEKELWSSGIKTQSYLSYYKKIRWIDYRISWATGKDNDLWCVAKSRTERKKNGWLQRQTSNSDEFKFPEPGRLYPNVLK